jgi:hypothetical protein
MQTSTLEQDSQKLSTVKLSFKRFIKDEKLAEIIQNHVLTVTKIVTEAYHLFNLHLLRCLESNIDIPKINQYYLKRFLQAVSQTNETRGRPPTIDPEIQKTKGLLYDGIFKNRELLIRDNLDHILNESATEMATNINNNIVIHFFKRQYKFIKILS